MKKALITGVAGQDGSYLSKLLLEKGYEVYGVKLPHHNLNNLSYFDINKNLNLLGFDLLNSEETIEVVNSIKPDEIYNFAARSYIQMSWEQPELVIDNNYKPVLNLLESIKKSKFSCKFYQASTSEIYGRIEIPAELNSIVFNPVNPYAASKLLAHELVKIYRNSFNIFACSGILFNHESPLRPEIYVSKKIVKGAISINRGLMDHLELGNLDVRRDWGFAGDFVRAMYLVLQQDQPMDYVVCTGELHSVREICEIAFGYFNLEYQEFIRVNPAFIRPADAEYIQGNPEKTKLNLGWEPEVSFKELITMMIEAELDRSNNSGGTN